MKGAFILFVVAILLALNGVYSAIMNYGFFTVLVWTFVICSVCVLGFLTLRVLLGGGTHG